MGRPSWTFALVLALGAGLVGLGVGTASNALRDDYVRLRYQVREGLGLEKNWVVLPGPDQADGREAVPCPEPGRTLVLVTGGQSNAANSVTAQSASDPESQAFTWFDGRCFVAEDPVLGATGTMGSLWPEMGQALASELGRPILFVNGAVGGTQVSDWLDDRSGYYQALSDRVEAARQAGFEPDLVIWHQGETDAGVGRDGALIERDFGLLADRLLADMPDSRLYLFQASKCIGANRAEGVGFVRDAQAAVDDTRERVVIGMNTDTLGNDYRWDTCHFNSLGRAAIVRQVAPELADLLR